MPARARLWFSRLLDPPRPTRRLMDSREPINPRRRPKTTENPQETSRKTSNIKVIGNFESQESASERRNSEQWSYRKWVQCRTQEEGTAVALELSGNE
jgi:hypothetical protein